MLPIYNHIIPFGSFKAMAIWPFIFIRSDKSMKPYEIQHEEIHGRQQLELLLVGFYLLYVLCWTKEMVHCAIDKNRGQASPQYVQRNYWHRIGHAVVFEREAYNNQKVEGYLDDRKWWAWARGAAKVDGDYYK